MEIRAAITSTADTAQAAKELCERVAGLSVDLAVVFVTPHHGPDFEEFINTIRDTLNPRNLVGCTCAGVIGPDVEIEDTPGAAMWAASLPGVRTLPFVLDQNDFHTLRSAADWQDRLGMQPEDIPAFMILPDPFSLQFNACLSIMDEVFPGSTIVGGVTSGAHEPGKNRLFLNDQILRQGMVGVSLTGPFRVSSIVSQGCRPIGETFVITKAESNVIFELGGKGAYDVLRELHQHCSPEDRERIRTGLHVGRAINEHVAEFGPGDFLIRNVAGVVENRGLAVTDFMRAGQTVQFHVRDAESADSEMKTLITAQMQKMSTPPVGGLLFSCNGRGTRMFSEPNHDIGVVNSLLSPCPVAGFFAAGEIGPVGGRTFVHGLTSSLILFHESTAKDSETEG